MTVLHLPTRLGPTRNPDKRTRHQRTLRDAPLPNNVRFLKPRPAPVQTDKQRARELYDEARADDQDDRDPAWGATLYEAAIKLDPTLAIAYTNLGNCYFRLHRTLEAKVSYQRALEIDPYQPEAAYNLGYIELEAGNHEIAAELLKQATTLDPMFADAWFNLGMALEGLLPSNALPVQHAWRKYLDLTRNSTDKQDATWREIAKRHLCSDVG